jgi:transcriptional regulator with XRE-family HTH domain
MTSKTRRTANLVDAQVGSRLRARRMALGMSQPDLADAIGLTFQHIQKYEKGKNRIGAGRLYQLAKLLKVDPEFFFESEIGKAPPPHRRRTT